MIAVSRNSFYRRLQLSFIILIILPVFVLYVYTYTVYKNVVLEKAELNNEVVLNVLKNDITKMVENITFAAQEITQDQELIDSLIQLNDKDKLITFNDVKNFQKIKDIFSQTEMRTLNRDIHMFIVNKESFMIRSARYTHSTDLLNQYWDDLKQEVDLEQKVYLQWLNNISQKNQEAITPIFFAKVIHDSSINEYLGVLNIVVTEEYFKNLFSQVTIGEVALYDEFENLIIGERDFSSIEKTNDLISEVTIPKFNWKLVYFTPESQLTDELTAMNQRSLLVISIFVFCFLILSLYLAKRMHHPIKELQRVTKEYGSGNRKIRFTLEGDDEIIKLGESINEMFGEIEVLIQNIKEQKEKQKELEIDALFSQIRPHFLMNTLNSIRCSLDLVEDTYHSEKILSLMMLMRKYLKANEPLTLKNECNLIEHYVDIMMMRNNVNVNLEIEVLENLASIKFPFLSLQPIVENCIIHGFYKESEGSIIITAFRKYNHLVIQVTDDGRGIPLEKTHSLNRQFTPSQFISEENSDSSYEETLTSEDKDHSLGLRNVYHRLLLIYGKEASLSLESEIGFGTTVTVKIPMNEEVE